MLQSCPAAVNRDRVQETAQRERERERKLYSLGGPLILGVYIQSLPGQTWLPPAGRKILAKCQKQVKYRREILGSKLWEL